MRKRTMALLILALAPRALGAELPVTETPVGRLALPVIADSLVVSPDSSRLAMAAKAGDPTLEERGVFINPQGTDPRNDSARPVLNPIRLYIDDKPTIPFDVMTSAVFSPDSRRLAYAGSRDKLWHVVLDGKTLTADADNVPAAPFAFSPDSAHVAWVVEKDGQLQVTVDDRRWPPIAAGIMGTVSFSPDSRHVAAAVRARGTWTLYVDGQALPAAQPARPVASQSATRSAATAAVPRLERFAQYSWRPDSAGLVFYAAFVGQPWQVFAQSLDGVITYTSPPFDTLMRNAPAFSPDGRAMAFAAATRGKWTVVTHADTAVAAGGAAAATAGASASFDQVLAESLAYCQPAGEPADALVYLAQLNGRWRVHVNHRPVGETFEAIVQGTFVVSPDRRHYAFAAVRDKQTMIVRDGAVVARHDEAAGSTFAFSPDSQHLAYGARNGANWFACVDGVPGAAFNAIAGFAIAFSPDSRRIAFAAATGAKNWHLVIDKDAALRSKPYDGFLKGARITWRPDGTVVSIAIQKTVATRLEARP